MPVSLKSYVPQGSVSLEVTVGQAQLGHITAFLNATKLVEVWNRLPAFPLGLASDLRGKILSVSATVLDVQPATDLTSVLAHLADTSGGQGLEIKEEQVSKNKFPINYFYVVQFR